MEKEYLAPQDEDFSDDQGKTNELDRAYCKRLY